MVLDATKPWYHREILTRELESVGMRLNRWEPVAAVVFDDNSLVLIGACGSCLLGSLVYVCGLE
jgi:ribosome-interacting GTPase 1